MSIFGQPQSTIITPPFTTATEMGQAWWDAKRERIYSWLRDQGGPGYAESFKGAAMLMHSKSPAYVRFVCHALRDITNGLPALVTKRDRPQVQYHQLVDEILKRWTKENLPRGPLQVADSPMRHDQIGSSEALQISGELVKQLVELLNQHEKGRARGQDNPSIFFEAWMPESVGRPDLLAIPRGRWKELHNDALSRAHENGKGCTAKHESECAEMFARFETLLTSLAGSFYESLGTIDVILTNANAEKKPIPAQVAAALAAIPRPEQASYFFTKLDNPEWLEPLKKSGSFDFPPDVERHESEGTIGFPLWPQGRYLVKAAAHVAESVFVTIQKIPKTENFRIHDNFLEAATAMPASTAARLVTHALEWWEAPHGWHLAEALERFMVHLTRGGEVTAALKIAEALLETLPDPDAEKKKRAREESIFGVELKPQMRTEWRRLQNLLRKGFPELVRLAPRESIQILASTLARLIEYAMWQPESRRPIDFSSVWRTSIESSTHHWQRDSRSEVIAALRDACEAALRSNALTFDQLDEILVRQQWDIFERMRLHLYRLFPELAGTRITAALIDRGIFERPDLIHERTLLLKEYFARLLPAEQQVILGWIKEGPPRRNLSSDDDPIDEGKWQDYVKRLMLGQLQPIGNSLPPDWTSRYCALVSEYGEPQSHDPGFRTREQLGSESPKSLEELRAMSSPEIVEFMQTWQPSTDFMTPNPIDLARRFEQLVAEQAARFVSEAGLFCKVDPIYVRSLICGLATTVEKEQAIAWEPVIDLCEWVAAQTVELDPEPTRGLRPHEDFHATWRPARKEIATLIGAGMKARANEIPFSQRVQVWSILSALCDDAEPSSEEESTSTLDPFTLVLNRVRGVALNQLADYGLWVRRHLSAANPGAPVADFNDMPELRECLEIHLDRNREPTLMARTSYGKSLPWLHLLDPAWTQAHLTAIFPREEEAIAFRRAAWISYVCYTSSYDNLLPVLEDEYRWAASAAAEDHGSVEQGFGKPGEGLADHLLSFYWRGLLGFDQDDDLLVIFYAHASDSLRAHGMWAVGRALEESKTSPISEVLARWQRFWEWRLSVVRSDPAANRQELNGFTWWLISDKFDADWSIGQMTEILHVVDSIEHETMISEYLAKVSARKPLEAVTLLGLIIEKAGRTRTWFVSPEETTSVLRNAYDCCQPAAILRADEVRDLLLSFGYFSFREIGAAQSSLSESVSEETN